MRDANCCEYLVRKAHSISASFSRVIGAPDISFCDKVSLFGKGKKKKREREQSSGRRSNYKDEMNGKKHVRRVRNGGKVSAR